MILSSFGRVGRPAPSDRRR